MSQYDGLGDAYLRMRKRMFRKGYAKDLPVMLKLIGDLKDKRLLDLGCGAGEHATLYSKKGAIVTGIDNSRKEISAAKKLNPNIDFSIHDINRTLPFRDSDFDTITACLVFDHLKDLTGIFEECHRILKPDGKMVFSMTNPVFYQERSLAGKLKMFNRKIVFGDYFKRRKVTRTWGGKIKVDHYHKPLQDYFDAFLGAGFELVAFKEPPPIRYRKNDWHSRNPTFLVLKLRKK